MSTLHTHLQAYLSMRRELGFKLRAHEPLLKGLITFLEARQAAYVTQALAVEWAALPPDRAPAWYSIRLSIARGFANYLRVKDPRTEYIPVGLLPFEPRRPQPYLYTQIDIDRLLVAAKALPPRDGLRSWTYHCLLGLLATTGLRITEARSLKREDVDLQEDVLTIRSTKFGKSRLVPIHPTTKAVLAQYAARRDAASKAAQACPYFLVGEEGRQLRRCTIQKIFAKLTVEVGLRAPEARRGPRLHDLRHSYAVRTLINGYRSGQDTELLIPVLSTFLGHSQVRCTYWYLTACPELLERAAERLQARWEAQS